ncbi:MAG: 5-methyltetrahydrofolate--homocysteine methyltransferase [Bacteroidaceae bacterium]|nr:5-methyltetrahydrofolate--homocysteine methyltransferase [Bacteroidaceae bacterium]
MLTTRRYNITELTPYIDWTYFLHAWSMPSTGNETEELIEDARHTLRQLEADVECVALVGIFNAHAQGNDIMIEGSEPVRIPCLRQEGANRLCLADFIKPADDRIGVFAATVQPRSDDNKYAEDPYLHLMVQTLYDRLAEATACRMHEEVRKDIWGYAPNEQLSMAELLKEKNIGIRPAVGYPSLPDQSINFLINKLINMQTIGITLTENGAMIPPASVSGLMIANSESRYFAIGKIDNHQLEDYATRRELPLQRMKQFLRANIKE